MKSLPPLRYAPGIMNKRWAVRICGTGFIQGRRVLFKAKPTGHMSTPMIIIAMPIFSRMANGVWVRVFIA